jgi:hypothetical protein
MQDARGGIEPVNGFVRGAPDGFVGIAMIIVGLRPIWTGSTSAVSRSGDRPVLELLRQRGSGTPLA